MLLSVFQRRNAGVLLKNPAEIGNTAESTAFADLSDGDILVCKQTLCLDNASAQNIVHHRNAGSLLKFSAEAVSW